MDEDVIQLIFEQYNSYFITYETPPGVHTNKDFSEAVYTKVDHEGTVQIEHDDISMETKIVSIRFSGTFGTLKFDVFFIIVH